MFASSSAPSSSLRGQLLASRRPAGTPSPETLAWAERRLEAWRLQTGMNAARFEKRLALMGLDLAQARDRLARSREPDNDATPDDATLSWLAETFRELRSVPLPEGEVSLLDALWPLFARFERDLIELIGLPLAPVARQLALGFAEQVEQLVTPSLVLELNVYRVEGKLRGDSSAARLSDFLDRFATDFSGPFFEEYIVLAQTIVQRYHAALDAASEIFRRLEADAGALRAELGLAADARVVSLTSGLGDRHADGRMVHEVRFTDGTHLAYKPRPCGTIVHYNDALAWLNARLPEPLALRGMTLLTRPTHGWVRWVESAPLTDGDAARRFFARLGAQLALLHALMAVDVHEENILAAGEHPVVIDLETLLHPSLEYMSPGTQIDPALDAYNESVMTVGLLPHQIYTRDPKDAVTFGGAHAADGATPGFTVPTLTGEGDTLALRALPTIEEPGLNLPRLDGQIVTPTEYLEDFIAGFRTAYTAIQEHAEEFIAGPLAAFAEDDVRVIMRATAIYGSLLLASYHPDHLRDATDQQQMFDRLWRESVDNDSWSRVVAAEVAALGRGDIPIFSMRPGQRELFAGHDAAIDSVARRPLEEAAARIRGFGGRDLRRQEWVIRASFSAIQREMPARLPRAGGELPLPTREWLIEQARAIGEDIWDRALESGGRVGWMGIVVGAEEYRMVRAIPDDVYEGRLGIALFLAQLGTSTGDASFTARARTILDNVVGHAAREPDALRELGALNGAPGRVYALAFLGRLWGDAALMEAARRHLAALVPLIAGDRLDLMGGSAGVLAVAVALDAIDPTAETRAVMQACVQLLVQAARRGAPDAVDWQTDPSGSGNPGFAHGIGGIAWAIARAGRRLADDGCLALALDGMRHEHRLYAEGAGNWMITTLGPNGEVIVDDDDYVRWCWGATGVGLARLALVDERPDSFLREDIRRAVAITLERGFGESHALCHGDLGNHDVLCQMGRALGDDSIRRRADSEMAASLLRGAADGWQSGNILHVATPGLFTGLAGIGYGLLRLAEPDRVPCLLTFELPGMGAPR